MKRIFFIILLGVSICAVNLSAQGTPIKSKKAQIHVKGACSMCSDRIQTFAIMTDGVLKAQYDLERQILFVEVDKNTFDKNALHQNIANAGHSTNKVEASADAYANLPGCCQYSGLPISDHNTHEGHVHDEHDGHDSTSESLESKNVVKSSTKKKKEKIHVKGACGMCSDRIQTIAILTDGVLKAEYDLQRQILIVEVDENTFDKNILHQNLADAGHSTNKTEASAEAYKNLPACCQYVGLAKETEILDEQTNNTKPFANVRTPGETVTGMIYERDPNGNRIPLIGATVKWLDQNAGTTTDIDGQFHLDRMGNSEEIEVSYVGYKNDTISMKNESMVSIVLTDALTLNTVEVVHRKKTTEISYLNPIKVQNIGEKEFLKAACCNIAESFETNPSVDVSFTDAVTGTRKIQLLGLEGPNIQVTRENMPYIRGLAALYGFEFTPGTWLEGIQLNMGTGSVANGYESLAGQINIELKKPCSNMEKFYLNFYANEGGRLEGNANIRHDINDKWYSATLIHFKKNFFENDRNEDGFLDSPLTENFIALHRWKYIGDDGIRFQAGVKGTVSNKISGQVGSETIFGEVDTDLWGATIDNDRLEGWVKLGKVFLDNPLGSMGLQLSGTFHKQDTQFGIPSAESNPSLFKIYDAKQESFYANYIYQNVLGSVKHKYRVGYSFVYDNFEEIVGRTPFDRREVTSGIFGEYTFSPSEKFTAVLGLRQDLHNSYGVFITPRANLRYASNDDTVFRLAAGRSLRTATVFAENIGIFASNRQIRFSPGAPSNYPYSLRPEIGWNFGANLSKAARLGAKEVVFGLDYYYTFFQDQVIVDYDHDVTSISIYNLDGRSYSHSVQAQIDTELFPFFDVRLAYRYNDVQIDQLDGRLRKPLSSIQRAFINMAYEIEHKWAFDATVNWQGQKRIPFTGTNPVEFQLDEYSPDYFIVNAQVTKKWKAVEWYLGVENLLNFRQDSPIISAGNPSSEFFDSSLVWGPIFGRNVYTGVRYKIP